MNVLVIAARELRGLFLTPFGWVCLAVFQFVAAWLFLTRLENFVQLQARLAAAPTGPGITDLVAAPFFAHGAVLLLLLTPLVTMRLVSGERQAGTLALLLSAPVTTPTLLFGKYLGALGYGLLLVILLAAMPLALQIGGVLDFGKLAAGVLGLVLLEMALVAIGLLMSVLATQPAAAAVSSIGLLLLLWIADLGRVDAAAGVLTWLSLSEHLAPFLSGRVDTADIAYYLLVVAACMALGIQRLSASRHA
jgi:ABC-2 type transport system permease protein